MEETDNNARVEHLISEILDEAVAIGCSLVEVMQACRSVNAACMARIKQVADAARIDQVADDMKKGAR